MNYDNQLNTQVQSLRPRDNYPDDYDADEQLDLLQYWTVINREKWGILGLALAVCLITLVFVYDLTPIYKATATLLIESRQANVVSIEEVYGIDSSQQGYFQTQFEILNSRQLAEDVIRKLELDKKPQIDSKGIEWRRWVPFVDPPLPPTEAQRWQAIVNSFQNAVSIEPIRNTQLVKISFESSDPELTYKVANALGNAYIENQLDSRLQLTQKASNWLTTRLDTMRVELETSEKKLQAFREREGLVDVSGVQTLSAKEVNEISSQLVTARKKTAEARGQLDSLGSVGLEYDPRWESAPGVLANPLVQQAKTREIEAARLVSELSQRYGPKHPKLIAARSNMDNATAAYRRQVAQVVGGFSEIYEQALIDERSLERALNKGKDKIQNINRKSYELSQLEREVNTSRELYNLFFTRFRETKEAGFEAANARFVDVAERPYTPFEPNKTRIVMIAGLLAMLVGVGLAFLKAALDNTIRTATDVEEKLNQVVIGVLPVMKEMLKERKNAFRAYLDDKKSSFAEAVKTIRTGVILSAVDKPLKVIVVTSSIPGEGKTTVALSLAIAFSQMEKVILIDADMRKPAVAKSFGLPSGVYGLSEIIAETAELKDCVHKIKGQGLQGEVIPAGMTPPNPLELLSSARFKLLIQRLSEKYDRVIIDSAPTQAVSDSMVLAALGDGVIYVVKSDTTAVQIVRDGLSRLTQSRAHVLGVVLNHFDAENAARHGYYAKGYYDYYGYGSKKPYA